MKKKIWFIALASVAAIALIVTAVVALSSRGTKSSWQEQYDLGVRYLNENNFEEAVIAFTAAIEIDPRNPNLYISRANAYTEMGNTASARADYEMALGLDDTLVDAWLGLAETYAAEGDIEKALEILQSAAAKTSDLRIKTKIEELESKLNPPHVHTWLDATCTEPKTCTECGETEGEALGHDMLPATTEAPSTCSRCGYTEGEPLVSGVTWTFENGVLTISGAGPMESCVDGYEDGYFFDWPWADPMSTYYISEIERVVIENGVTTIGDYAFQACGRLTSVEIPESVTTIGDWAFYKCNNLAAITIPDSVTVIGGTAFRCCYSLTSVTIPSGVTTIDVGAFSVCENLTSVVISDGVTTIGEAAFMECFNLTTIKIPDSVTTIGESAFFYCNSLTDIYYGGTAEQWAAIAAGACIPETATIHYNYSE